MNRNYLPTIFLVKKIPNPTNLLPKTRRKQEMGRLTEEAIFLRLSTDIKNRLNYHATRLGASESAILRMALVKFIEAEEREQDLDHKKG